MRKLSRYAARHRCQPFADGRILCVENAACDAKGGKRTFAKTCAEVRCADKTNLAFFTFAEAAFFHM